MGGDILESSKPTTQRLFVTAVLMSVCASYGSRWDNSYSSCVEWHYRSFSTLMLRSIGLVNSCSRDRDHEFSTTGAGVYYSDTPLSSFYESNNDDDDDDER